MTMTFQATSSAQGKVFETEVKRILTEAGWTLMGKGIRYGIEIDIIALNPDGIEVWIECKGSIRGNRPGCKRTDTVRKGLFTAYHLQASGSTTPYYIVTSHLADTGLIPGWVAQAKSCGALTDLLVMPSLDLDWKIDLD